MKTSLSVILTSLCFIPTSQAALASAQQTGSAFPIWAAVLISSILILSIIGLILTLNRRKRRVRVRSASPPPARPARKRRGARRRKRRVVVIR